MQQIMRITLVTLLCFAVCSQVAIAAPRILAAADMPLRMKSCELHGSALYSEFAGTDLKFIRASVRFHFTDSSGHSIGDQIVEASGGVAEQVLLRNDLLYSVDPNAGVHCLVDRVFLRDPDEAEIYSASAVLQPCAAPSRIINDGGPDAELESVFVGSGQVMVRMLAYRKIFFAQSMIGLNDELYGVRLDNGMISETTVTTPRTTDIVMRLHPIKNGMHRLDFGSELDPQYSLRHFCFRNSGA